MALAPSRSEFESQLNQVADVAYRVAYNLTRNKDDAMDLVQDAVYQAYRSFETFQTGTNFKAWFLRVLTNRFLKTNAKLKAEMVPLDDLESVYLFKKTREAGLHGNNEDPASLVIDRLDVDAVQDALDQLPDEFRMAAVMYFLNDFTYDQIAEVLDVPIGTVRSRLHRGRKLLQKALWDVARARGIVPDKEGGALV